MRARRLAWHLRWWQPVHGIGRRFVRPDTAGAVERSVRASALSSDVPSGGSLDGAAGDVHLAIPYPARFSLAPSRAAASSHLTDGDLLLRTLGEDIHPLIAESLRDAVRCLRADLYLPAVAMLGKATEGAWTLLATAVAAAAPGLSAADRLARDLESEHPPAFAELVRRTVELFARQDRYGDLAHASGVRLDALRAAAAWTDVVRDSRNVVHFAVETPIPNTYEKAATLVLGVPTNIGLILRLAAAAAPVALPLASGRIDPQEGSASG